MEEFSCRRLSQVPGEIQPIPSLWRERHNVFISVYLFNRLWWMSSWFWSVASLTLSSWNFPMRAIAQILIGPVRRWKSCQSIKLETFPGLFQISPAVGMNQLLRFLYYFAFLDAGGPPPSHQLSFPNLLPPPSILQRPSRSCLCISRRCLLLKLQVPAGWRLNICHYF